MADELNQVRAAARQSIDAFIDNRLGQLFDYIDGENNMHNLQIAINRLTLINNNVTNPALFAGEVAQENLNQEEFNEVRNVARESVTIFTNDMITSVSNSINALNNMHDLEYAINQLNVINAAITNPALIVPPPNNV